MHPRRRRGGTKRVEWTNRSQKDVTIFVAGMSVAMAQLLGAMRTVRRTRTSPKTRGVRMRRMVTRAEGFGEKKRDPEVPEEALRETLSSLSQAAGRNAETTNVVLGGKATPDDWRELDEKVNTYPMRRGFKAIGTGGEDFVQSVVGAVEGIVGDVPPEKVTHRPSSKGNYISVNVGPCWIDNPDQVIAIYAAIKTDKRVKWII